MVAFLVWITTKPQDAGLYEAFGWLLSVTDLASPWLLPLPEREKYLETLSSESASVKLQPEFMRFRFQKLDVYFKEHIWGLHEEACKFPEFFDEACKEPEKAWRKAFWLFISRYWDIKFQKVNFDEELFWLDKSVQLMVPVADMVNMGPPETAFVENNPKLFNGYGGFEMYANKVCEEREK